MLVLQSEQVPRRSSQLPLLLTVLQAAILMVLVALAPFVMRFDPPAGLGHDVWTTYHDPQAVLRFFLIALGVLRPYSETVGGASWFSRANQSANHLVGRRTCEKSTRCSSRSV